MNIAVDEASLPARKDGVYNTNPYVFIEDNIRGLMSQPQLMQDRERTIGTYKEITLSFYEVNKTAVDLLSYFKTLAASDITNNFYQTKVMDLEIILTTAYNLFSHFQALAFKNCEDKDNSLHLSDGFCFAALTTAITLKDQILGMHRDKIAIQKYGILKTDFLLGGISHPSCQYLNDQGYTMVH